MIKINISSLKIITAIVVAADKDFVEAQVLAKTTLPLTFDIWLSPSPELLPTHYGCYLLTMRDLQQKIDSIHEIIQYHDFKEAYQALGLVICNTSPNQPNDDDLPD